MDVERCFSVFSPYCFLKVISCVIVPLELETTPDVYLDFTIASQLEGFISLYMTLFKDSHLCGALWGGLLEMHPLNEKIDGFRARNISLWKDILNTFR